jgi:tetratricopeptide (TPR) repeat protein
LAENPTEEIKRLRAELQGERNKLRALRGSFSYQLGNLLVNAARRPGRNTLALPVRLLRLMRLAVAMEQARRAIDRMDWARAVRSLRSGLSASSGETQAKIYVMLGHALRQQGLLDEAEDVLQAGIAKYPTYLDLLAEYSQVSMTRGDWQTAYRRLPYRSSSEARQQLADRLPVLGYGSINEGVPQWRFRWSEAPSDRRVLMVAPTDFAGAMYHLADAVNRYSPYAVRLVTFALHEFNYPVDLVVPECSEDRLEAVLKLASEAAIFHLADEHSWFLAQESFLNLKLLNDLFFSNKFPNALKVFTHYGSYARKFRQDGEYIARVRQFDGRIAFTPDLDYDWFNGMYIPHAIDTDTISKSWCDSNILAHSPTKSVAKGTPLFQQAVSVIQQRHHDVWRNWSVDIIHGVSHDECMRRKRRASLFFDQAGSHSGTDLGVDDVVGWYGVSAVEAMALGIPTIAHLSDVALERAGRGGCPVGEIPVINTPRTCDGMVEAILSFATRNPQERGALSERTRQFAVEFHGYEAVAGRMASAYDGLLSGNGLEEKAARRKTKREELSEK